MQIIDVFSGIGGFSYAGDQVGWETVCFVEIDSFCQKVLKKHWPDVPIFSDIKQFGINELKKTSWNPSRPTAVVGGFPCQPFSIAGKRKGRDDDRYLWPEMLRVICEVQPSWVVAENVPGLINQSGGMVFEQVLSDLETEGYEVQPVIIPTCAKNAVHRRDRVWIVATPVVMDTNQGDLEKIDLRRAKAKEKNINGNGFGMTLGEVVNRLTILPTPQNRDYRSPDKPESGNFKRKKEKGWTIDLNSTIAMLPTPTSRDYNGGNLQNPRDSLDSLIEVGATKNQTGKKTGLKLQPAFVEWMMGFPQDWTKLDKFPPNPRKRVREGDTSLKH